MTKSPESLNTVGGQVPSLTVSAHHIPDHFRGSTCQGDLARDLVTDVLNTVVLMCQRIVLAIHALLPEWSRGQCLVVFATLALVALLAVTIICLIQMTPKSSDPVCLWTGFIRPNLTNMTGR